MKELYRFRQFLTEGVIKKEVTINGKTIDVSSIKIEGVDTSQGYDDGTTDAFASYAEFKDGSELSDNELDKLTDENTDLIHELALEVFQMGESTEQEEKDNRVAEAALILPRGKKVVLQAEEDDYQRGLIVELTNEGGYKINYWYGEDVKIYPAEVEVDGKSIKDDANEVYIKFHPELEK